MKSSRGILLTASGKKLADKLSCDTGAPVHSSRIARVAVAGNAAVKIG